MMPLYTQAEREVTDGCTPRQLQILAKLARIIGPDAESLEQCFLIETLIGKNCDDFDMRRVLLLLKNMKRMFEDIWIEGIFYCMRFNPVSLSYVKKLACSLKPPTGRGTLYGDATLALKQALGIHTDVNYWHKHGHENFNYGEDTSYLDPAFVGFWRMNFGRKPHKLLKQSIEVIPRGVRELGIYQTLIFQNGEVAGVNLGPVDLMDFLDPEKWEKIIPGIVEKTNAALAEAMQRLENDK